MSVNTLESEPQLSISLIVLRIAQNGMRASSRSWKKPGAPYVRSKLLITSRRMIVSDSPQAIDCRPMRVKKRPLVKSR